MDVTEEHKNEIQKKIVEAIIAGLGNKSLLASQLSEIAKFSHLGGGRMDSSEVVVG